MAMTEKVQQDYYELLGVSRFASQEQIDDAYRELALELHPDIQHEDEELTDDFLAIQEAYDVLSDPQRRKAYNSTIISFTTVRNTDKRDPSLIHVIGRNYHKPPLTSADIAKSLIFVTITLPLTLPFLLVFAVIILSILKRLLW